MVGSLGASVRIESPSGRDLPPKDVPVSLPALSGCDPAAAALSPNCPSSPLSRLRSSASSPTTPAGSEWVSVLSSITAACVSAEACGASRSESPESTLSLASASVQGPGSSSITSSSRLRL